MDEHRKYALLFAATILAARKLNETGSKPCPAPFVQQFHYQYFKRLAETGLLIRTGRGRYRLYHTLFREFLPQTK